MNIFNDNNYHFFLSISDNNILELPSLENENKTNNTFSLDELINKSHYNDVFSSFKNEENISFLEQNNLYFNQNQNINDTKNKMIKFNVIKKTKRNINSKRNHNRNSCDNLSKKIQVHYLSFLVSFINDILKNLDIKDKFFSLNYTFKRNVNKDFVDSLKKKNIGEILCNKISKKYKKYEYSNTLVYNKVKQNEVMNKILSLNYMSLFSVYFKSSKLINLKEYGFDKDIILSNKVKMYKDIFQKYYNNKEYIYIVNQYIIKNFIPNLLFITE